MKSTRVLLSDRHAHTLTLTEQEIGVACHALEMLAAAFDSEFEYLKLIRALRDKLAETTNEEAIEL